MGRPDSKQGNVENASSVRISLNKEYNFPFQTGKIAFRKAFLARCASRILGRLSM